MIKESSHLLPLVLIFPHPARLVLDPLHRRFGRDIGLGRCALQAWIARWRREHVRDLLARGAEAVGEPITFWGGASGNLARLAGCFGSRPGRRLPHSAHAGASEAVAAARAPDAAPARLQTAPGKSLVRERFSRAEPLALSLRGARRYKGAFGAMLGRSAAATNLYSPAYSRSARRILKKWIIDVR